MATAILLPSTTPPDYHRIVSPTLRVPEDPLVSVPVGLLACQRDPLLRSLDTTIVSVTVAQPPPPSEGKKTKKAVLAPDIPREPLLHVLLHDTVVFPEGGGQPTDTGFITISESGEEWEVVQCKRHGGHAVHYVKLREGVDVDAALLAFQPGVKVTVALGEKGYERRYDHMSMHTSQHMLSALLETRLNLPTLSWSLTSFPSPCYIEVPRGMTLEEIASVQAEANRLVFEGRRVHVEVAELDPVEHQGMVASVPKLESGRAFGKALPEDYTGGVKRVIVIDGVDRNPCCGTHLPSIHNLQLFLLPHTEALSRSSTTSARLYFLSGPRLIQHLGTTHALLSSTSALLSCGAPAVPERVAQVVEERRKAEKRLGDVEQELAGYIAKGLFRDAESALAKEKEGEASLFKQAVHRVDDTGNALGFLNAVAFAYTAAAAAPDGKTPAVPYVIILSSSPSTQTATSVSTVLVIGSDDAKVKAMGEGLKSKLGIKGGGKGPRWSGKFVGVWKEGREDGVVAEILASV